MDSLALKYLALIFGGCLGVYQIAAVAGGFKGLWFFRNAHWTVGTGLLILAATYLWFFSTVDLRVNADRVHPVVEGTEQMILFLLGSFLALVVTFLLSSALNTRHHDLQKTGVLGEGLEDLKSRTVLQALTCRLRNIRGEH